MSSEARPSESKSLRRDQWHTVFACFLGWTLDAFDFFAMVFLIDTLALQFHVGKSAIVWTLTATLAMRPVGAVVFGLLSDRYGRRVPLMANVIFYSLIELLCGFSPNYTTLLVLRSLYGIGMGGEWGVGASLAMETAPRRWRGIFSGVLQSGYSIGYLLAAAAARFVLPAWGWRAMFWVGGAPALLALYIRSRVPESEAWKQHHEHSVGAILRTVSSHWKNFAYLVLLMTFMMFFSHGTQDLYPDFLKTERHLAPAAASYATMISMMGAVVGAVIFGQLSESIGRRWSMIAALALSLTVIPLWAFSGAFAMLALGAFLMQAGVQGAWGIIPAHLNEVAPDSARGLLPGLAYQLGILVAAPTNTIEYAMRDHIGYARAMAAFEVVTMLVGAAVIALGSEKHGKEFLRAPTVGA